MSCFAANIIENIFAYLIIGICCVFLFKYIKTKSKTLHFKQCKLYINNQTKTWEIKYNYGKKLGPYNFNNVINIESATEEFFDENRYYDELAAGHMIGGFKGFVAANDYAHNDSINNNYYIILNLENEDVKLLCNNKTEFDLNYSALKKIFKK